MGQKPKPHIVVRVRGIVVVAVGAADIVLIVVERTPAQRPSRPYNRGSAKEVGLLHCAARKGKVGVRRERMIYYLLVCALNKRRLCDECSI